MADIELKERIAYLERRISTFERDGHINVLEVTDQYAKVLKELDTYIDRIERLDSIVNIEVYRVVNELKDRISELEGK